MNRHDQAVPDLDNRLKLVTENLGRGGFQLYDIEEHPAETRDLGSAQNGAPRENEDGSAGLEPDRRGPGRGAERQKEGTATCDQASSLTNAFHRFKLIIVGLNF